MLSVVLALASAAAAVWLVLVFLTTMYRIVPLNDFGRFYYSSAAFVKGEPMYAWNPTVPGDIPGTLTLDGEEFPLDLLNLNPPHFHLLFAPLAVLPVETAFALWTLLGLASLWLALRLTIRATGAAWTPRARELAWFVFLGSAVTTVMVSLGQVGWVLLLPATLLWLAARRGQSGRCGLWLGVLVSLKPFFLIFAPYFLLKGKWRVLLTALAVNLGIVAVSLPLVGWENYRDWLTNLTQADAWGWQEMNGSLWGLLIRSLTENPLYVPLAYWSTAEVKLLWLVLGGLLGLLTLLVAWRDQSEQRVDRAFALLLVGAVLFSPLGWIYYFPLPLGPLAALLISWRRQETSPGRDWRWWLLGIAVAPLFLPVAGSRWFQPSALATFTLGSIFFWSLFVVWIILVVDGLPHVRAAVPRFLAALPRKRESAHGHGMETSAACRAS